MKHSQCDILVVGGGTGGCAATLAITALGKHVIMADETDWIGGQLTSQATPFNEHMWVDEFGSTRRYRALRNSIRQYYRDHYPLTQQARGNALLNPGKGNSSRLCHEPRIALTVLEQMLAFARVSRLFELRQRCRAVAVDTEGDRARSVTLHNLETGNEEVIVADYILDATELGDLLPMAAVEYVTGAESAEETGEPHAPPKAQPGNVEGFTWCFPLAYDVDAEHVIERPLQYDHWRHYLPKLTPSWPGRLLDWAETHPVSQKPFRRALFPWETDYPSNSLWADRRIVCREHYASGAMPHEVTLVDWPQNDYWEGNVIDAPPDKVSRCLEESRQLSLSWLYWMQTEAGYPGLYLRPDITGTNDGLAKAPHFRESRRIRAVFTVTENHVARVGEHGVDEAAHFEDSVGVGFSPIFLHPTTGGNNYIYINTQPFQIPLGAILPVRIENLLPACRNIGTTHITNACYRSPSIEWNIGEASGLLAAFCLNEGIAPRTVRAKDALRVGFQKLLQQQGVELSWPWQPSVI